MDKSSAASKIKAYSVPVLLFGFGLFYQVFVLPRHFPPSHYDVLRIPRYSSVEAVKEAYEKLSSKWNSSEEIPPSSDFIRIRYAYELLVHPLWKRNYDVYGIDEQIHVLDKISEQYSGQSFSDVDLPLLDAPTGSSGDALNPFNVITSKNFLSIFNDSRPWLIQVYSDGSRQCEQFSHSWRKIVALLDGIANTGMVELGDIQLATYLAEEKSTGHFYFRNGLPSLIAFPSGCKASDCVIRYEGELSVDAVTDWFATNVLRLPRVFYYTKESLGKDFLAKVGPHKVKVILFSRTGERATPFIRQISKNFRAYASFAFVLWREEESSFWWNTFEVESAPAIVFLKDPGVKPTVYHGLVNNSWFLQVMEQNKLQELPQLRSLTSMDLGCDTQGYSRAGNDTMIWYCVILAGRLGPELNEMRETMRRVQELLSTDGKLGAADIDQSLEPAVTALKHKRLTFAWLDGEVQERYCSFYLASETSFETCGPRRDPNDVPRLFVVRYKRNATENNAKVDRKPMDIWSVFHEEVVDHAAQLVVKYNGPYEIPEILKWVSHIVKDGDLTNLPFYRIKTPELVPEEAEPFWAKGAQGIVSQSIGVKQRISNIISRSSNYLGDPRIGPALLLAALMSYGTVWLVRSQRVDLNQSGEKSQSSTEGKDKMRPKRGAKARKSSKKDRPFSMTDVEPKDAYEMELSDSDSQ